MTIAAATFAVGLLLAAAGFVADGKRAAYSYLTGYYFTVTIALGGMVLTNIQHLTRAGWSVAPRRAMEWLGSFLPIAAVLFIPVALSAPTLYHEWWPAHGEAHHVEAAIQAKHAFLNPVAYYGLSALFFIIWGGVGWFYLSTSRKLDETGDPALTMKMERRSPPIIFLVAYSLACSGILWVMSMRPAWFSTMWGVYIFAGAMTSSLAVLSLMMAGMRAKGLFNRVFTVEHQHDLGKFLFGFTVFFAYIAFCQFFLIWYANIPEETAFYKARFVEAWKPISWMIVIGHFALPFAWLLPRTTKRSIPGLAIGAGILLFMHWVDMYWIVMPGLDEEGPHFSWIDLGGLLAPAGALATWVAYRASRDPIYPIKDPRVPDALRVDNGQG
jgi:hypothetical protein